jgi:anti-anti-sigma factor
MLPGRMIGTMVALSKIINGVLIIAIKGQIRISTQSEFREFFNRLVEENSSSSVILNMAGIGYINSAGIGMIVDSFRKFRENGGRLGPFFLGILFAWFCYRTGSIIAGILAHFTNNLLAVLINWYNRHIPVGSVTLTPAIMGELIILASVVGFILAIMLKAFGAITKGKVKPAPDSKKAAVVPVITHWPMLAVYSAYLIITVLFLISLTRPIL